VCRLVPGHILDKIILLRDQANGDRTVGFGRRAEIAFGEFAAEMQSRRSMISTLLGGWSALVTP